MATCIECVHVEVCRYYTNQLSKATGIPLKVEEIEDVHECDNCPNFKDRSRFVDIPYAEWIEDEDMYGEPIYHCSNCNEHFVLAEGTPTDNCYFYCPNCGAKMDEQALKERE